MTPSKSQCPKCGADLSEPTNYRFEKGWKRYVNIICTQCESHVEKKVDLRARNTRDKNYTLIG